jgi:opacity protein-like surface antigen
MSGGLRLVLVLAVLLGAAVPASAQEDQGARISGSFAGVLGEGDTNMGFGGAVGYRFSPHVGIDFEVVGLPDFSINDFERGGRGVAFLTQFVSEFPSPARWLTPYVLGGGGVANVTRQLNIPLIARADGRLLFPRDRRFPVEPYYPIGGRTGAAETNLALTVGGGVDFNILGKLAIGPNISYMKLFGSFEDLDLTRIGVRAAYRF